MNLNLKKLNFSYSNINTNTSFIFNDLININRNKRSVSMDDVNSFIPGIIFDYKNEEKIENKNEEKIEEDDKIIEFNIDIKDIEEIKSETNLNLVQSDIQQNDIIYTVKKYKINKVQFIIHILLNILFIIGIEFKFERWMYFFIVAQIVNFNYHKNKS